MVAAARTAVTFSRTELLVSVAIRAYEGDTTRQLADPPLKTRRNPWVYTGRYEAFGRLKIFSRSMTHDAVR